MTTPYDPAIRIKRRQVDDIARQIGDALARVASLDEGVEQLAGDARREAMCGAEAPMVSSHHYAARLRTRRAGLMEERAFTQARLASLRAEAASAIASLQAIETAAERHRAEHKRRRDNAVQAQLDDMVASSVVRRHHASREHRTS